MKTLTQYITVDRVAEVYANPVKSSTVRRISVPYTWKKFVDGVWVDEPGFRVAKRYRLKTRG